MDFKRHFGGIILLAMLLGFAFPEPGFLFKPYPHALLMLLMFTSCLKIDWREVKSYLKDTKHMLFILLIVHMLTAIIALLFRPLLSEELFLGLVIAAVAPAGLSAVYLCDVCRGKPADALALTSMSNLLSPATMPLLVFAFAGASVTVNAIGMVWLITKIIVLPFIAAQIMNHLPGRDIIGKIGKNIAIPLVIMIILAIIAPTREQVLANLTETAILFGIVSLMILCAFFSGWFFAKERKTAITYAITSSYKNFTLSTVVALTLFGPVVALPSIVYTIANNVWLVPMNYFFAHAPRKASR